MDKQKIEKSGEKDNDAQRNLGIVPDILGMENLYFFHCANQVN